MSKPTRVVDFEHFLNDGELPPELPLRARALALAQIVEVGGPVPPGHTRETTIGCKRRPGGRACPGILWVLKEDDNSISTFCLVCKTQEHVIRNWEDSVWAKGPMEPVEFEKWFSPSASTPKSAPRAAPPADTQRVSEKIPRNAPCPCGSGKKYKRCCGAIH